MTIRSPGQITIDGVDFELLRRGEGFAWDQYDQAVNPGGATPEEGVLATKPPSFLRTSGFLDWSHGAGASVYRPGETRFHWSDGPSGELPRQIVRAHEVRRVALTALSGAVTDFFEIGGAPYVVNGAYVRKITPTLNAETVAAAKTLSGAANGDANGVYLSGVTFTEASAPWYDSAATKVFLGVADSAILSFTGAAWAQATAGVGGVITPAKRSRWALGTYSNGQRLWGGSVVADGLFLKNLPQGQDPFKDEQWSTSFPLANRAAVITGMAILRDSVVVACSDGMVYLFDGATGNPTPLLDARSAVADADSGKGTCSWNGMVLVPLRQGLFAYEENSSATAGTFVAVGMESLVGNASPVNGRPTATCPLDAEWFYCAFYNGTDSYVYKARRPLENEGATTRLVWQPACPKIAGEKVTRLSLTRLGTNPVLLVGTDAPAVHFVTLPRPGKTAASDGNCRSTLTANSITLSDHDGLTPTTPKTFWRARVSSIGVSAVEPITVYARLDGGDWQQVGAVRASPYAQINLPGTWRGRSLGLRFAFSGTDATRFPSITGVEFDYTQRPDTGSWADAQVYVAQDQLTDAGLERIGVDSRLDFLARLVGSDQPVEVIGPDGVTYLAELDATVGLRRRPVEQIGAHKAPGWVASFRLNFYTSLTGHDAAVYGTSVYTTGTQTSYYAS